jgi:Helix-turn-helix domain
MTSEEVLRLLMIARSTVIRLAQRGVLRRGGGGRALYHRADVERLSRSRRFAS